LLPTDPLSRWRRLEGYTKATRDSYTAAEIAAIIKASKEWDTYWGREHGTDLTLLTLPTSGNRPGAVFAATVADLQADRIRLGPGQGKKNNGACTLPVELIARLRLASQHRGQTGLLLVSPDGSPLDMANFGKRSFKPAAILAFTHELWPHAKPEARECTPIDVAAAILHGKAPGFDGPPPTDPEKIKARDAKTAAIETLRKELAPAVKAKLKGRPFYAYCRHSHETLASVSGVHPHAIDAQIGHDGKGTGARHYLDTDQLNPLASSTAVYKAIMAELEPKAEVKEEPLAVAVGAENESTCEASRVEKQVCAQKTEKSSVVSVVQPLEDKRLVIGGGEGSRTLDLCIANDISPERTNPIPARTIEGTAGNSGQETAHNSAQTLPLLCSNSCRPSQPNDLQLERALRGCIRLLKPHLAKNPELTRSALMDALDRAQVNATPRTQDKQDGDAL
jgi:hypothetical protein